MEVSPLLDSLPLWALFLLTLVIAILAVKGGYWLATYRKQHSLDEKELAVGPSVGAILALLAFMLAFTFGMAGSRFEERRQVVLAEANAIETAYLRAAMLPDPVGPESRDLLREYVDVRLEAVRPGNLDQAIWKAQELHKRLWAQAVAAAEKSRPPASGMFIQSINDVIDLHAKRLMVGLRSRVPGVIWIALYVLAAIAMAATGYQEGLTNTRSSIATLALVFAFSSVMILIADLDRPGEGLLQTNQQAMIDVRNSIGER